MQETSELWKQISSSEDKTMEYRADIAESEYFNADIFSLKIEVAAFPGNVLSIGNVMSAKLNLSVKQRGDVPRMSEIKVYVRMRLGGEVTEWLPKGIYYIDTRSRVSGRTDFECYDKVLMLEKPFIQTDNIPDFPMPMTEAVQVVLDRLGIGLDSRTVINAAYNIDYPNEMTMREVLGCIASTHVGNFVLNDKGELALLQIISAKAAPALWVDEAGDFVVDEMENFIKLEE